MHSYLGDAADFSVIRRVLVIKLQHLGDVLLTTPVFAVLKQRYPQLEIDALVFADTAPLLGDSEHISRIFTLERISRARPRKTLRQRFGEEYRLYRALQTRRYDLIIVLTDRWRAAWLTRLLRPRYSVAQKYPHKRGARWRKSFTHLYDVPTSPRHTVETHLDALRRLGVYPQGAEKKLHMPIAPAVAEKVAELCVQRHLQPGNYIVMHPVSRWMFKSWSATGFAEVLRALTARGLKVALVSGPAQDEQDYAHAIMAACNGGHNLTDLSGQLTLPELAALLAAARCFVGLDSVAMHMAAAVGTPTVALFGPSDDRVWGPWMVAQRTLASSHSCRPCHMDGCGNGKVSDCLQSICADEVMAALSELLAETRP
ncbi:MAG: putative lipopolysaccharide heptosyltransferase III [Gammaproteobacteria bacterium]